MEESRPPHPDVEERTRIFLSSACEGDIEAMRAQVVGGFDLNGKDRFGDTILERVINDLEFFPTTRKYEVIREMLRLGADPQGLSEDGSSPLLIAVLNMDAEMVRILLDAGADPNAAGMRARNELLYDWADFVYRQEVWNVKLPEEATMADRTDIDAGLRYLDRLAVKYGRRRPDHLRLLRERGALSISEWQQRSESGSARARTGRRSLNRVELRRA
ncbi:ankyrin repeat domain-containing protein [Accumulibacter sp.]|uniref:ankyrin repeat domain-containing protein n=1 Tax=Accumulibacter sp. TaxID=2053492 RepID=UPI001A416F29|nr:ankyrin repeat domain-containing protein [Accumulibacter sp.]MBL8374616.1 ankyrin repeat domain-containing protein [Accumulibacter sp.]